MHIYAIIISFFSYSHTSDCDLTQSFESDFIKVKYSDNWNYFSIRGTHTLMYYEEKSALAQCGTLRLCVPHQACGRPLRTSGFKEGSRAQPRSVSEPVEGSKGPKGLERHASTLSFSPICCLHIA